MFPTLQKLLLLLHFLGVRSYSTHLRMQSTPPLATSEDRSDPTTDSSIEVADGGVDRIGSTSTRFTTKPLGPGDAPLQGRESPHAPDTFNQRYTFGFNSDYYCSGRIMDEPRKMRLTCTKNPNRKMNCQCDDQQGNSLEVKCRCGPAFTATKKHINLVDAFVGN
jgi:hypothetical protein